MSTLGPGVLMHGPTFMANPLACAVSLASVELLTEQDWAANIARIEQALTIGLTPARTLPGVVDVRVLGAIGVIELAAPVDMHTIPHAFIERGVWLRPFGRLVYVMPPYIISDDEIAQLTGAMCAVVEDLGS